LLPDAQRWEHAGTHNLKAITDIKAITGVT
jgi:hypothetical protein